MANAYCERLIRTIRRECLDFLIPLNERHLHRIVREFVAITTVAALIPRLGLESRNHRRQRLRQVRTATGYPTAFELFRR
jgi:hypothetical protein